VFQLKQFLGRHSVTTIRVQS